MSKSPMTLEGAEALREELQRRKTSDRSRIKQAIAEARAHGDLKENAEYHAAREEQGFNEGRVQDIESKLANAEIIDVSKLNQDGRIVFGTTVKLVNVETDDTVTYKIVGEDEADIKQGKVSVISPLARALIGRQVGDEVSVDAPGGTIDYEVLAVEYR
ncbi:MAG: transcription elongation factor GreA [Gammaproteobacteria bacterium]|nr:transcription elongation factor GreA [Gammaproteobacteria bacterium]